MILSDNWFIRGSALGPIGGLSARQFNGCLPRSEEKREKTNYYALPYTFAYKVGCGPFIMIAYWVIYSSKYAEMSVQL